LKCNASEILRLLRSRHKDDVFVDEVKTGPTGNGLLILDAWAMKKSWSRPSTIGYEIKVSRSDFTRDSKWHGYLDYCNEFYFVAPPGIIRPDELPPEAGLLTVASTKTKVFTKKKAVYRKGPIPNSLYRYLLMCRCEITRDISGRDARRDYFQDLKDGKRSDRELGHFIAYKTAEKILNLGRDKARLERRNQELEMLWNLLREAGFDPGQPDRIYAAREFIKLATGGLKQEDIQKLESARKAINEVIVSKR
tara:strand:+ start:60705 stop:61457 length:753 start_codon:yes stop_codon:yes gene_type:complete